MSRPKGHDNNKYENNPSNEAERFHSGTSRALLSVFSELSVFEFSFFSLSLNHVVSSGPIKELRNPFRGAISLLFIFSSRSQWLFCYCFRLFIRNNCQFHSLQNDQILIIRPAPHGIESAKQKTRSLLKSLKEERKWQIRPFPFHFVSS